jgi:hypothetical protein
MPRSQISASRRRPVPEHAAPGGEPAARIENHPRRVGAGDSVGWSVADRRIPRCWPRPRWRRTKRAPGAGAGQIFRAVDVAGHRLPAVAMQPVQALTQMRDRQRPGAGRAKRHRQIQDRTVRPRPRLPGFGRTTRHRWSPQPAPADRRRGSPPAVHPGPDLIPNLGEARPTLEHAGAAPASATNERPEP